MTASLYLVLPVLPASVGSDLADLVVALGAEAVLLPANSALEVVSTLQAADIAVLVDGCAADVMALGADGLHLSGDRKALKAARTALGGDCMLGVSTAENRHSALELGDAGVDYVAFGAPGMTATPAALEVVDWWRDIISLPSVVFVGTDLRLAAAAATAGADFVALEVGFESGRLLPPGTARDIAAALATPSVSGP